MIFVFILVVLFFFITRLILQSMKARFVWFQLKLMMALYWYHILFAVIYYVYVQFAASDSVAYYERTQTEYQHWLDAYGTGTTFIDFVAYPFIHYGKFTYEMMMLLFAWMGYWGFVFFYIVFRENIRYKHTWQGIDLVSLTVFLPNMHYWTASLGKGALIFLGLGLTIYGLSRLHSRKLAILMGLLIVYYVRPHVFFLVGLGILAGLVTGRQKVPLYQKMVVLLGIATAVFFLYDNIMQFANLDSDNLLESFDALTAHKSVELAKAGSGIDISGYPLGLKLLTFWFRPLFFDAPGVIGVIVSFENLFYLILAAKIFQLSFFRFMGKSSALIKTSAVVFLAASYALAGTLSNLGIIIRQKSMVMYFLLLIILAFMDYKKGLRVVKKKKPVAIKQAQLATS